MSKAILDTTHPLLLRSTSVHGTLSSEKDNSSQALPMEPLYEAPCVGCSSRRCGSPTGPGSCPSCVHVKSKGGNKKVEIDSRTHTRSRAEEQLDGLSGVTRPAPLAPAQTHRNLIAALVELRENGLEAPLPDDDEIDYDKTDSFATFLKVDDIVARNPYFPDNPLLSSIQLQGDETLVTGLVALINKFSHLFSNALNPSAAEIPPFELKVNLEKWQNHKNRGPPRVQSPAKQAETAKQIDQLLAQGIIERSNASYYSQIVLTPKPPDGWRFCIDYKNLNDCTEPAS